MLLGEKDLLDNREMQIKSKVKSKEKTEKSKEKSSQKSTHKKFTENFGISRTKSEDNNHRDG